MVHTVMMFNDLEKNPGKRTRHLQVVCLFIPKWHFSSIPLESNTLYRLKNKLLLKRKASTQVEGIKEAWKSNSDRFPPAHLLRRRYVGVLTFSHEKPHNGHSGGQR